MKNKGRQAEVKFIKTINSGAFYQKGDAISDTHCLEIKYTEKKSFRLSTELLEKIRNEAFDQNKLPMFGVIIEQPNERWLLKIDIIKEKK